jgi:hypothetical protein
MVHLNFENIYYNHIFNIIMIKNQVALKLKQHGGIVTMQLPVNHSLNLLFSSDISKTKAQSFPSTRHLSKKSPYPNQL